MEDKFPGSSHEDSPDDATVFGNSRERGGSAYVRRGIPRDALFRRLFENSHTTERDDEDEEDEGEETSSTEKKRQGTRRFRRSFRNIFRRQIMNEPNYVTDDSERQDNNHPASESVVPLRNFGDWLRRMSTSLDSDDATGEENIAPIRQEVVNQPASRVSIVDLLSSVSSEVTSPEDDDNEGSDSIGNTLSQNNESTDDEAVLNTGSTSENSHAPSVTLDAEQPIRTQPTESLQQIMRRQSSFVEDATPSGYNSGSVSEAALHRGDTTVIHNETYNTLNGWGPALVVDQLSRRRDRKIRRHNTSQDKQIAQIEQKRSDDQQEAAINLQQLQSKVEKIQQSVVNPIPNNETRPARNTQNERLAQPMNLPEKFMPRAAEFSDKPPKEQIELAKNVEKITTAEVIQKTVEKAAEAAVPIESLYERRHEIKGNDDFATSADAAINTIVDKSVSTVLPGELESHTSVERLLEKDQKSKMTAQNDLYSQAAKGGALLAILIIVAFLVIYMLNR